MSTKYTLERAKEQKADEFYTQLSDIEKELKHYDFKGKRIYCNCDDYRISNFYKYFKDNFHDLGIKKLTATGYKQGSYKAEFNGVIEKISKLQGDGCFASAECLEIMSGCDMIVTNPPFSIIKKYLEVIENKEFLIIAPVLIIAKQYCYYKLKDNIFSVGNTKPKKFIVPYSRKDIKNKSYEIDQDNNKTLQAPCIWLSTQKPREIKENKIKRKYVEYDNFDAINIDKLADIPENYYGVMGVPVTYLCSKNDSEFDILAISREWDEKACARLLKAKETHKKAYRTAPYINDKQVFTRVFIKRKTPKA